jgi:hypothetical protein
VLLKVRHDQFEAYVDGEKLCPDERSPNVKIAPEIASGKVGLATNFCACRFKNIRVTDPDGKILYRWQPQTRDQVPGARELPQTWLREVAALPAEQQVAAVRAKLQERNPGCNAELKPRIENGAVVALALSTEGLEDISPVRALPGLQELDLRTDSRESSLADLTPMQGMKLRKLSLHHCSQVRDLSPLRDMPLMWLSLQGCGHIQGLAPLEGMPLTHLNVAGCHLQMEDLAALRGMKLTFIYLGGIDRISDFAWARGMPLAELNLWGAKEVGDFTALHELPLQRLWLNDSGARDLTLLEGMRLEAIGISPNRITRGMDALRRMRTLKTIRVGQDYYPAAEFWKRYDAGEFKK